LERALSDLIEQEGRAAQNGGEETDTDAEGPIMMKSSQAKSAPGTISAGNKGGVLLTPTVVANRQDAIEPATAASALSHGIVGSDATLRGAISSEKEKKQEKKDKHKHNRISRFFNRDTSATTAAPEQHYNMEYMPRPPIQPSKAGVLSNLLKLQGTTRHSKVK
jgi:hypothetical protein